MKEKFRNMKQSRAFLIFLECVKITPLELKLDRPQLQQWLLMLYQNRPRSENTDAVAGLSIPVGYEWIMIQLATNSVLLILSDAGSSSSYYRIHGGSSSCKFETSYLTLNRPGYLESSTTGGLGVDSRPPCKFSI